MAIDEADQADSGGFDESEESETGPESGGEPSASVGEYTWAHFMEEYGYSDEVGTLYPNGKPSRGAEDLGLSADDEPELFVPSGSDWDRVEFDPAAYLGYNPDDLEDRITETAAARAKQYHQRFLKYVDPETTPVVKDVWTWEHFKWEYYYDSNGDRPRSGDEIIDFDPTEYLSFDPEEQSTESVVSQAGDIAKELDDIIEERTVDVNQDLDEDEFFSTADGHTTLVNRYDLEKSVPLRKKTHFQEQERYWVNKPYAFVIIFHSRKENEKKYYLVEPYHTEIEGDLKEFLTGKLRTAIKYADDDVAAGGNEEDRKEVIERETKKLLRRYDLYEKTDVSGETEGGFLQNVLEMLNQDEQESEDSETAGQLQGIEVRPEPIVLEEDPDRLSEYQIEKLLYVLKRDFIGYERIDGIKHDINVEDISCDGYNSPVFVYHTDYEQIISNVYHGEGELDEFVVKLAQRSGKGISKRRPQVDATLPDGSRAQLTLGREVSDHGTNYTIRQFKDVPFTPIDLVNWNTFSLEEMAFLWLCIENHKSLIFAGGTASGKTTSLNAVSLFIPSNTKIVSIEDTREVELPQRNWVASVTRPSFSDDDQGDVDEFDLLEAALRQRPDYIVMGEIRGEEGRTLFQVMSTGHTTYTTFHADSVGEVLKRFTTDPINVSKTMFTALDLVSIQTQTRVQGNKVRRNKKLTEVNHYDADTDEINVQDVYQWQAETDEFLKMGDSNTLAEIKFDRGWSQERLENEIFKREVILAYLIKNGINEYTKVAATIQAFINDPDTILTLIANGQLEESLEDLREMESVKIQVDPEKEALVPRPDPDEEGYNLAMDLLEQAEEDLFEDYRGDRAGSLESAIGGMSEADASFKADSAATDDFEFGGEVDDEFEGEEFEFGDGDAFTVTDDGNVEDTSATGTTADVDASADSDAAPEEDIEDLWEETETPAIESGEDSSSTETEPEHPALEASSDAAVEADPEETAAQRTELEKAADEPPALSEGNPDTNADTEELPETVDAETEALDERSSTEEHLDTADSAAPDTPAPADQDSKELDSPADSTTPSSGDEAGTDSTADDAEPGSSSDGPFSDDTDAQSPFDDDQSTGNGPFGDDQSTGNGPFGDDTDDTESPFGGDGSESPFEDSDTPFESDGVDNDAPTSDSSGPFAAGDTDATDGDAETDSELFGSDSPVNEASTDTSVFDDNDTDEESDAGSFEDGDDPFGGGDDEDDISGFEDLSFDFDDEDDDES